MANTSLKPLMNHLKSILNNKEDGRNSSILFLFLQTISKRCFLTYKKTLSTMITENHADFIIAVMGISIKFEKAGVRN